MKEFSEFDELIQEKAHLLPAWFCEHMLAKDGHYALVLEGGVTVAVKRLVMVHQDNASRIWLDVEMMSYADAEVYFANGGVQSRPVIAATGEQHKASINAASVMIAYDLGGPMASNSDNE